MNEEARQIRTIVWEFIRTNELEKKRPEPVTHEDMAILLAKLSKNAGALRKATHVAMTPAEKVGHF